MLARIQVFVYLFIVSFCCSAEQVKQQAVNDLRVVIDVSGSMKQNDPVNMRIPALKLLINLLPEGAKAGVWLFAEQVAVLVAHGQVNEQWRKLALSKLNSIHSKGLLTDIEQALETVSADWLAVSDSTDARHLLLLTDGMVDVSKDIMQSAESRERVLVNWIPLLQQANVAVQTIALSDNADKELLQQMSLVTGGGFERVQSAEALQRVFFRMFKQTVPQETVPIKNNTFLVDSAIKELSVLLFRQRDEKKSRLFMPDGKQVSYSAKNKDIAWLKEKGYDLVTVKNPQSGTWRIDAQVDPDNEVMIVTDLQLQTNDLPAYLLTNEEVSVEAYLTEQQQLIMREDFLGLLEFSVHQVFQGKEAMLGKLELGENGVFMRKLNGLIEEGQYLFRVVADGQTFQRVREQVVNVIHSPVSVSTEINNDSRQAVLKLVVDESVVNKNAMVVQVAVHQKGQAIEDKTLNKQQGEWRFVVDMQKGETEKVVNFSVQATTVQGQVIVPLIKPVVISAELFSEVVKDDQIKVIEEKQKVKPKVVDDPVVENVEEESEPVDWSMTTAVVLALNSAILLAGFLLFRWIQKRAMQKQTELLSRLSV